MNIASSRHFSKLVQDYVGNFSSSPVKDFFFCAPHPDNSTLQTIIEARISEQASNGGEPLRNTVIAQITDTHTRLEGLTTAVNNNLELFRSPKCVAVVTGQQVGILGGPLYTIYKALHTILLCKQYTLQFPEYSFVPVFWQETEDHDFEEVRSTTLISSDFELKHISYEPTIAPDRLQVGSLRLETEALQSFFESITSILPHTDFTDEVFALFKRCYQGGVTFADAQASLLCALFAEDGLLVLNPNTRLIKSFALNIFEKEITTAPSLSSEIANQSESIKTNYHTQIDANGVNLFLIENGKRIKIQLRDEQFFLNDTITSKESLLEIVREQPERLSMNVVMRPLVQDTILPTIAYVAGPGEIAYFAQLSAAYRWANMQMPVIIPRISLTLAEDRFEKLAQKHNTSLEALIEYNGGLVRELLLTKQEEIISDSFVNANDQLEKTIEQLRNIVEQTDGSLAASLTTLKGKSLTQLKDFSAKVLSAERKKNQASKQQFEKALNVLLPDGKLQEREINLFYFLNKYGQSFWIALKEYLLETPHQSAQHSVILLSDILSKINNTTTAPKD